MTMTPDEVGALIKNSEQTAASIEDYAALCANLALLGVYDTEQTLESLEDILKDILRTMPKQVMLLAVQQAFRANASLNEVAQ